MRSVIVASLTLTAAGLGPGAAVAQVYPPGFSDEQVVTGLNVPTTFVFTPEGRMLIGEQDGVIRVWDGGLLPTPAIALNVEAYDEQGLLDLAVDPDYPIAPYLYVFYTPFTGSQTGNTSRVSRFTFDGDLVDPGSEVVLLDDIPAGLGFHLGGCIRFAPDGMLLISTGDTGWAPPHPQDLSRLEGKMLRIAPDGSIPPDNPFVGQAGAREEIWQWGLRNPFRFAVQPTTGWPFIADVGYNSWEEINAGAAAANFGWPVCEGACNPSNPAYTDPFWAYPHDGMDSAIVGCTFYGGSQFPAEYVGNLFFFDHARGHLGRIVLDGANQPQTVEFPFLETASQGWLSGPVDLREGPDGALYYCTYVPGQIRRIVYTGGANRNPVALASASPTAGLAPLQVSFDGSGSWDPDGDSLAFSWDFGDGSPASSDPAPVHTYGTDGTRSAVLTVTDGLGGVATAPPIVITVGNEPPGVQITAPPQGTYFEPDEVIFFTGQATDPEDGPLTPGDLRWTVNLHHGNHIHPVILDQPGAGGSFVAETHGESLLEIWYRITLRATDSGGLTSETSVDVVPDPAGPLPITRTWFVPSDDRDAVSVLSDVRLSGYSGGDPSIYVSNDGEEESAGLQFVVDIPSGAEIQEARLTLRASPFSNRPGGGAAAIALYDVADAAAFVGGAAGDLAAHHPLHATSVPWPVPSDWAGGAEYETPDLKDLVQAWVDRPDHVPGSHLGVVVTEGTIAPATYWGWADFAAGGVPTRLTVTWLEAATGAAIVVFAPDLRLDPPAPNPFRTSTRLSFTTTTGGRTTLRIYDVSGRLVSTLLDGYRASGSHATVWNGVDLRGRATGTGVYFVRLDGPDGKSTRRILRLR